MITKHKALMKKYILFSIFAILITRVSAQDLSLLNSYKDSIARLASEMVKVSDDKLKVDISDKISNLVFNITEHAKSINYNFDELKFVKVLTSSDKKFRVFTWVIPFSDKTYAYRGIAQCYNKSKKEYTSYTLTDKGDKLGFAQNKTLDIKKWYGAYYYKMIETKRGSKRFYTLIGWRGISRTVQSKVIEVVTIKNRGNITFGYNIFDIKGYDYFGKGNRSSKRLIFKFSTQGNMYLNYDYQTIIIASSKSKKHKRKTNYKPGFNAQSSPEKEKIKTKSIKDNMIVLDRLVPTSPQMKEFYDFYYPESNIIDALLWQKNKWKYYADIDARNKVSNTDKINKKIEYDLVPK